MHYEIERTRSDTAIMNVRDVAEYLRLSQAEVYKLARNGCMPALRMGKLWRFRKDLIDDWIRKETKAGIRSPN